MDKKFWWINRLIDNFSDNVSLLGISSLDTRNIVAYGTADFSKLKSLKQTEEIGIVVFDWSPMTQLPSWESW